MGSPAPHIAPVWDDEAPDPTADRCALIRRLLASLVEGSLTPLRPPDLLDLAATELDAAYADYEVAELRAALLDLESEGIVVDGAGRLYNPRSRGTAAAPGR